MRTYAMVGLLMVLLFASTECITLVRLGLRTYAHTPHPMAPHTLWDPTLTPMDPTLTPHGTPTVTPHATPPPPSPCGPICRYASDLWNWIDWVNYVMYIVTWLQMEAVFAALQETPSTGGCTSFACSDLGYFDDWKVLSHQLFLGFFSCVLICELICQCLLTRSAPWAFSR